MAEEAGCIDFYNYVYSPFSGCVHSMWQHIGQPAQLKQSVGFYETKALEALTR